MRPADQVRSRWRWTVWFGAVAIMVGSRPAVAATELEETPAAANDVAPRPVVIDASLAPDGPNRVKVRAEVEVRAAADEVWDAVMDFDARVRENWMVDDAIVYSAEGSRDRYACGVRWELSVAGIEVSYHTVYAFDRRARRLTWQLDGAYKNDLNYARGEYRLEPADSGYLRLVYVFEVESGHIAPLWVRRRLTRRGVETLLDNIRTAAEARGRE